MMRKKTPAKVTIRQNRFEINYGFLTEKIASGIWGSVFKYIYIIPKLTRKIGSLVSFTFIRIFNEWENYFRTNETYFFVMTTEHTNFSAHIFDCSRIASGNQLKAFRFSINQMEQSCPFIGVPLQYNLFMFLEKKTQENAKSTASIDS